MAIHPLPDITYPAHVMINISESALAALIPHSLDALIANAQRHLRRVYPRGTRIESSNPDPLASWSSGSQIAALNWQRYDLGVQVCMSQKDEITHTDGRLCPRMFLDERSHVCWNPRMGCQAQKVNWPGVFYRRSENEAQMPCCRPQLAYVYHLGAYCTR